MSPWGPLVRRISHGRRDEVGPRIVKTQHLRSPSRTSSIYDHNQGCQKMRFLMSPWGPLCVHTCSATTVFTLRSLRAKLACVKWVYWHFRLCLYAWNLSTAQCRAPFWLPSPPPQARTGHPVLARGGVRFNYIRIPIHINYIGDPI